ncbi:MAG TPA: alpha/beta hydrolase fold domain-containing protein [Phycisphaerales bacterium]|nr:alpha/beta hydrolase fold domain-containing protein [Phycisphaerales bacterium]
MIHPLTSRTVAPRRPGLVAGLVLAGAIAAAAQTAAADPVIYRDIPFADHWSESFFICYMDLYLPADHGGPWPTVIWIHGGSWSGGNRRDALADASVLIRLGYAVAAIEYRFSQVKPWPAQIHDCKGAARWLRGHAQQYHLDSDRFIAWGQSAGGHLAAVMATSAGNAELEGTAAGYLEYSSSVQACVDFLGPSRLLALPEPDLACGTMSSNLIGRCLVDIIAHHDDPAWAPWLHACNTADPTGHITPATPPFLISHGLADSMVDPQQSFILRDALVAAGHSPEFYPIEGQDHFVTPEQSALGFDFIQRLFPPPEVPQGRMCPDCTLNGSVGLDDIAVILQHWGRAVPRWTNGDVTGDGSITINDLAIIVQRWGEICFP